MPGAGLENEGGDDLYKIRVTTTVEQIDHDGRVLFHATDTEDASSIDEVRNTTDVPLGFKRAVEILNWRLKNVLLERYRPSNSG